MNDKLKQENELLNLLHYLEKSLIENDLTDKMIREAKHEQNILMQKLEKVRSDLQEITGSVENTTKNF